ncbi:hypothetical protein [Caldisericum exile]|uniref:hypothetical protein n=1 Tax=Caldisericum exile TaxID=693075 RepID=UPI003C71D441
MEKKVSYFEARKISPEFYADYKLPHYLKIRLPSDKDAKILDFGCGFGQIPKDRIIPVLKNIRAILKSGGCYLSWFLMLKVTQEHTGHMKILCTLLYLLLVVYIMFLKWQVLMK